MRWELGKPKGHQEVRWGYKTETRKLQCVRANVRCYVTPYCLLYPPVGILQQPFTWLLCYTMFCLLQSEQTFIFQAATIAHKEHIRGGL